MSLEETIMDIINNYGKQIWLSFISLVITGFVLMLIKSFIQDLVYYFRARMSDIGRGQRILYKNEILIIDKITFKFIEAHDDQKIVLIPINKYINDTRFYPINRYDDFDEQKYFEKPWDGKTERRKKEKK